MPRKRRYTAEQIINKLREAEVLLSQGKTVEEAAKILEVAPQTYYRWRREYGCMDTTQARKLKGLEKENTLLKKLVADLSLDNAILKEVLGKKNNRTRQKAQSDHAGDRSAGCVRAQNLSGIRTTSNDITL